MVISCLKISSSTGDLAWNSTNIYPEVVGTRLGLKPETINFVKTAFLWAGWCQSEWDRKMFRVHPPKKWETSRHCLKEFFVCFWVREWVSTQIDLISPIFKVRKKAIIHAGVWNKQRGLHLKNESHRKGTYQFFNNKFRREQPKTALQGDICSTYKNRGSHQSHFCNSSNPSLNGFIVLEPTWRIIPVSKWLITMVGFSSPR